MRNYYGLRCSAKRVTKHKVTFSFVNGSASETYTSSPPAGGAVSLRLVAVAVPQAELRFSVSPGDRFIAAPLLRSPQGEAKVGIMPRGLRTAFARIQKLSPLCTTSLSDVAPVLPVTRGVSGGGAALSPGFQLNLCSLPKHGAHFAAQSPERSFFFPLFLSPRKKKRL